MADFAGLIGCLRKLCEETIQSHKPSGLYFGKVTSVFDAERGVPALEITIDPKHVLTEEFIVYGRYVTEFSTDFDIDNETRRGLRVGDELMLIREQGGQRYAVADWVKRVEEDARPAWICTGRVLSGAPTIKVNDYLTLTAEQLILCRNVTDYEVDMSVSHNTENEQAHTHPPSSAGTPHLHEYKNRKKFLVHNGLVAGDTVLLICMRSSQKWYVVDFIQRNQSEVRGEWI